MSKNSCFTYNDYRKYLENRLPTSGADRGLRARLAEHLHCQSAFISRVFAGKGDFSLEHAASISRFLGHTELEREYFLLLVHEARAGSSDLIDFYRERRREVGERHKVIAERIQVKSGLSKEDQMTYYSSWQYAAIHVLLTVPTFRHASKIAEQLQLPLMRVQSVLDFLESAGLAAKKDDGYIVGNTRIHLGSNSPLISKHHSNWRMKAMQAMEQSSAENLFFSGPISMSLKGVEKIRGKLLKFLEEVEPILSEAAEEEAYCLNLDFFRL
jgi:uncharacterized protein (TIGR02147 family)